MNQKKHIVYSQQDTQKIYCVDSYVNGISFGSITTAAGGDYRNEIMLQAEEGASIKKFRTRYAYNKVNPLQQLELNLMKLSNSGKLSGSVICLGVLNDPFLPFEGKFHTSLKFIELFAKYKPGRLIIQTRSPLIVLAMPVLNKLGKGVSVTIGLETSLEKISDRYTPAFPSVKERLKTINVLRNFGIEVTVQVAPLLPYGDSAKDAPIFADCLCRHADFIHVLPIVNDAQQVKYSPVLQIANLLARDRMFYWLRKDSAKPLLKAIELIAPQKLKVPDSCCGKEKQLNIFAA